MQYVLLIYDDETRYSRMSQEEQAAEYEGYNAFGEKRGESLRGGKELQATTTATAVRVRDGQVLTTDGPFAETKEQLGGFYIIEAANLDEAIAAAAEIPGAKTGCIEVRPVVEREGM